MKYREFGNTGIKVSEIGFGAWAIGGNEHGNSYGSTEDRVSIEAIHRSLDIGCNFFDTADVYGFGHSEELLGRALRNYRDRAVIATKVGGDFYSGLRRQTFSASYIRLALDKSLSRLKTDYIDVYQLHNPPLKLIERPDTYAVLQDLKREGKIRAWGLSIFDPVEGLAAIKVSQPDCLQVVYNIFSEKPAEELFPRAQQIGCAVIAREPLANGFLTGKYDEHSQFEAGDIRHDWPLKHIRARTQAAQKLKALVPASRTLSQFALQFVLSSKFVSVVIPGAKTPEQAEENLSASDCGPLTADELTAVAVLKGQNFGLG